MNDTPITLNHFFLFDAQNLAQDKIAGLESSEEIIALRNKLSQQAKGISWSLTFGDILEGIKELLSVKLEDILVEAWKKTQELSKYRDPEKSQPQEIALVHLVEHTINSEHHPVLEVVINNVVVERIEFIIKLALSFKGIILRINQGKIKEILPGSCKGKGSLAWGKFTLLEEETKSFALPQSLKLGDGIPI